MKLHKRLLSVVLALVMMVMAVFIVPVKNVQAANTVTTNITNYITTSQGHWSDNQSLYCENDGDYTNYVATDSSDPAYKNRHVSVFNDCDSLSMELTDGVITTPRGKFTVEVGSEASGDGLDLDSNYAPNVIHTKGGGRHTSNNYPDLQVRSGSDKYARFAPHSTVTNDEGATDVRMIFRNFFNTDITHYNNGGTGSAVAAAELARYTTSGNSLYGKQGLDIDQYQYFEFDLYLRSGINLSKASGSRASRVYFFYETNDASQLYLSADDCIAEYEKDTLPFSFADQLYNADGSLKLSYDTWHTIRIPLDTITSWSPVKQVTIRFYDNMSTASGYIGIDNLRFVKTADHTGGVYRAYTNNRTDDKAIDLDTDLYPSGHYFLINDFESLEGVRSGSSAFNYTYAQVRRYEETNLDDTVSFSKGSRERGAVTGNNDMGWLSGSSAWSDGVTYYSGTENVVTQGHYATAIQCRSSKYKENQEKNIYVGAFYYREFGASLDLSQYTHFAMDMYIRPLSNNRNKGIPNAGEGGTASTFQLTLITDTTKEIGFDVSVKLMNSSVASGSTFDAIRNGESGGVQVLPLNNNNSYVNLNNSSDGAYSSYGAMRIIFTREDIMKYFTTNSGADLANIQGMRFIWVNGMEGEDDVLEESDKQTTEQYDIMLDNFIAYTPETSMTIETKMTDADQQWEDEDISFIYDVYGGYEATESEAYNGTNIGPSTGLIYAQKGEDPITAGISNTVVVKPGEKVTIEHLPFNSYYITQQNWTWRYAIDSVTSDKIMWEHTGGLGARKLYAYTLDTDTNTVSLQPQVSWCCKTPDGHTGVSHGAGSDGCKYTTPIYMVMRQRNFTITITQKRTTSQWLDGAHSLPNDYS